MSKDEYLTRVEYGERTLEAYLEELEEQLPLRHRLLCLNNAMTLPVGAQLFVCKHGHVHLVFGPHHSLGTYLMDGLYGYTMALILDTRAEPPKRPGLSVVHDRISKVQHAVSAIDMIIGESYANNLHVLHSWLDRYAMETSGKPLFPRPEVRQKARVSARRPNTQSVPKPPQETPVVSGAPYPNDPFADVDTGTSQIVRHPFGARMFGILATPFDVGEA